MLRRRRRDGSSGDPEVDPDGDPAAAVAQGNGETVVGARTRIRGRLKGRGAVLVRGSVVGEIDIHGGLTLAPTGSLEAEVEVQSARLSGHARGSMRATSRVILETTAVFEGKITTPVIDLRPGAVLRGRASILGPAPTARRKLVR